MFCTKCGKEIKEGVLFCKYCGEKTEPDGPSVTGGQAAQGMTYSGQAAQGMGHGGQAAQGVTYSGQAAPSGQPVRQPGYPQAPRMAMPPQSGVSYGGGMQTAEKKSGSGKKIGMILAVIAAVAAVIVVVVILTNPFGSSFRNAKKGDIITFGSYEQDGNTANGKEPIEWEVLDVEDDSILVVSRYVLDCQSYITQNAINEGMEYVTWGNSSLRTWLNSTFYGSAFTSDEQAQIQVSHLVNPGRPHPSGEVPGGGDTEDKVFCLSMEELTKYYAFNAMFPDSYSSYSGLCEQLITPATAYVQSSGLYNKTIDGETWQEIKDRYESLPDFWSSPYTENAQTRSGVAWWLRSSSGRLDGADIVSFAGGAGYQRLDAMIGNGIILNQSGDNFLIGVRPAMRISR